MQQAIIAIKWFVKISTLNHAETNSPYCQQDLERCSIQHYYPVLMCYQMLAFIRPTLVLNTRIEITIEIWHQPFKDILSRRTPEFCCIVFKCLICLPSGNTRAFSLCTTIVFGAFFMRYCLVYIILQDIFSLLASRCTSK